MKPPNSVPMPARHALELLRFDRRQEPVAPMSDQEWRRLLTWAGPAHLQLALALRCREDAPAWVREDSHRRLEQNRERVDRLDSTLGQVIAALTRAELPHLVLKGITHSPDFTAAAEHRPQYDIDLLVPQPFTNAAFDCVRALDYEPIAGARELPVDHLPTLIRKTGWRWQGDYLDVGIPFAVEMHFRLWDAATEGFPMLGLEAFWDRRVPMEWRGHRVMAFERSDRTAYAALHALRHLLRGDLRPHHLYEIAYRLHTSVSAREWIAWPSQHDRTVRQAAAVVFSLARIWFACDLPESVTAEIEQLPVAQRAWLARFAFSPISNHERPNKDELLLHLCLVDRNRRPSILRRRLLPAQLPGPVDGLHTHPSDLTLAMRVTKAWKYGQFVMSRVRHHLIAPLRTGMAAPAWWWRYLLPGRSVQRHL